MPPNLVAPLPILDTVDPFGSVCPYSRPLKRLVKSHTIEAMPGLTAACCPGRSRSWRKAQPDPLLCWVLFGSYTLWPEPRQLPPQLLGQPPAMPLTPGSLMECKRIPRVIMGGLMSLPWGPRDARSLWIAAQGLQLWVSGSRSSSDEYMHAWMCSACRLSSKCCLARSSNS